MFRDIARFHRICLCECAMNAGSNVEKLHKQKGRRLTAGLSLIDVAIKLQALRAGRSAGRLAAAGDADLFLQASRPTAPTTTCLPIT